MARSGVEFLFLVEISSFASNILFSPYKSDSKSWETNEDITVKTGTSTCSGQNPLSSALSAWLRRELATPAIKLSVRWMGWHRKRTSSVGVFYKVHQLHHVLWKFNALLSYMNIKLIIWWNIFNRISCCMTWEVIL